MHGLQARRALCVRKRLASAQHCLCSGARAHGAVDATRLNKVDLCRYGSGCTGPPVLAVCKEGLKGVWVLLNGIEAVLVLTLMFLKWRALS